MISQKTSRRTWLKTSILSLGAVALSPDKIWADSIENAHKTNSKYLYPGVLPFNEYTPPQFPDLKTIKARLCWNENPFGPSPMATEAFMAKAKEGNYYAWPYLYDLINVIAEKEGVKSSQIMMGPGSSDLLEKTAIVAFTKGGNIVSADPCYMSLVNVAKSFKGEWKPVKLTDDYQHNLVEMEKAIDADTKLVYITNPNNPTGTSTDSEKMKAFCRKVSAKVPVFVDEAYLDLTEGGLDNSVASLIGEGYNIMVTRTFSKIHGMAGLRIGYMIAQEETLEKIDNITRGGMGITGPSIAAAAASLEDKSFLAESKSKIKASRRFTMDYLDSKGFKYLPSETNFIIFPIALDGNEFLSQIYERKIAVRCFDFWGKNWCRVSMGKLEEMKIFTSAIDEILV